MSDELLERTRKFRAKWPFGWSDVAVADFVSAELLDAAKWCRISAGLTPNPVRKRALLDAAEELERRAGGQNG